MDELRWETHRGPFLFEDALLDLTVALNNTLTSVGIGFISTLGVETLNRSVEEICNQNHQKPNFLYFGDFLCINLCLTHQFMVEMSKFKL